MTGPVVSYDVVGLRSSAAGHDDAAERARALAAALSGIVLLGTDIGGVPAVAGFVAAAQAARDAHAAGARAEAVRRTEVGQRARDTAALGERLDVDTATAATATSGAVPFGDGANVLRELTPPG